MAADFEPDNFRAGGDNMLVSSVGNIRHRMIRRTEVNGTDYGINAPHRDTRPSLDQSVGMLHGYQPNYGSYVSNTGYTPRNIIPILLEAPRGFAFLPDSSKAVATLKNLMESQAKTISGLRTGYEVSFSERQVSSAGHMMSDPSNVTEAISQVSYTWDERYGKAIQAFWKHYVRNLIADPTTNQPGVMNIWQGAVGGNGVIQHEPTEQLADFFSFTMLFIEPDPLRRYVFDAWLINNMIPHGTGIHESGYDVAADFAVPEVSIEFTGMPVQNMGVTQLAQDILTQINYIDAGPLHQGAHVPVTAPAVRAQGATGYREEINMHAAFGHPAAGGTGFDGKAFAEEFPTQQRVRSNEPGQNADNTLTQNMNDVQDELTNQLVDSVSNVLSDYASNVGGDFINNLFS